MDTTWHGEQRRHHTRVPFLSGARYRENGEWIDCEVHDLSLKGALIAPRQTALPGIGHTVTLEIRLDPAGPTISMQGCVAHAEHGVVGLRCERIDLDSITHLRRLIELNLGDATLLERELSALLVR